MPKRNSLYQECYFPRSVWYQLGSEARSAVGGAESHAYPNLSHGYPNSIPQKPTVVRDPWDHSAEEELLVYNGIELMF